MSEKPRMNRDVYVKNRSKYLPEDLLPYAEEWVAWSLDASRIIAHHRDLLELGRMLDKAGIDSEEVNFEWIPPGGEIECLIPSLLDVSAEWFGVCQSRRGEGIMSEKPQNDGWPPDPDVYNANRTAVPLEELAKIGNQWSAWSMDGSRIIAHHQDLYQLFELLKEQGLTTADVVMEFIPPGGVDECLL